MARGAGPYQSRYAKGFTGARCGSQCAQIRLDSPRRLRNIAAGEWFSVRLPQTKPDAGFVPGVKGSPVQIRPSRPEGPGQKGYRFVPGPLFDVREPMGSLDASQVARQRRSTRSAVPVEAGYRSAFRRAEGAPHALVAMRSSGQAARCAMFSAALMPSPQAAIRSSLAKQHGHRLFMRHRARSCQAC